MIFTTSIFICGCSTRSTINSIPANTPTENLEKPSTSVELKPITTDYQLKTSKSPTGAGHITYLRWNKPFPDGVESIQIRIYAHDSKRNGGIPKTFAGFGSAESRIVPFWSKDGSVFAILLKDQTYYAYDFHKHEATAANLWGPSTPKSKRIQALLAQRGGKTRASFSKLKDISFREFQNFPVGERIAE